MKSPYLHNVNLASAYLELNKCDLENIELDYVLTKSVKLSVPRSSLTDEEFRQVKKVFGPLEVEDNTYGASKGLKGKAALPSGLEVTFCIQGYMTCRELDPDEVKNMTEQDWLEFKERALDGHVTVSSCEDVAGKATTPSEATSPKDF